MTTDAPTVTERDTIRVVLAEDSLLVREGVTRLLGRSPDIEVVATCDDLPSLRRAVRLNRPDVVVTDIRMPPDHEDEGIRVAVELRRTAPGVGVVVLSQFADPTCALALVEEGSSGRAYLLKERIAEPDQLAAAIRAVAGGGSMIDPVVVDGLVSGGRSSRRSALDDLTDREREVLAGMAEGKSNAAIARAVFLAERSVEKHIHAVFSKLGLPPEPDAHRRVKAVLVYLADRDA
jgi:DNA-binding NarL/FixJ family response regulator